MDDNETLDKLLEESPIPKEMVLQHLSHLSKSTSHISLIADRKLLDLYIEKFNGTSAPEERAQLQWEIGDKAGRILMFEEAMAEEEVTRLERIVVEYLAPINKWEYIRSVVERSKHTEVADYAAEMARKYNAPALMANLIYIKAALLNNNPNEAVRIAEEAKDYALMKILLGKVPEETRKNIEDKLWEAAKSGKLPLGESIELAKQRKETISLSVLVEMRLALVESPYEKAILSKEYNIGELGKYILECAAELQNQTAALRENLQKNPVGVAKQLDELGRLEQVKNYLTHPEQSKKMDLALQEAYLLITDALILSGKFEEAFQSASRCNHPKKEWLNTLYKLSTGYTAR